MSLAGLQQHGTDLIRYGWPPPIIGMKSVYQRNFNPFRDVYRRIRNTARFC